MSIFQTNEQCLYSDVLNKTRITFDYKLKLLILNFRQTHKEEMVKFSLKSYLLLIQAQAVARQYFYDHQQELNIAGRLTNSSESMPDYYALMRALIVDLELCDSWEDVSKQILFQSKWTYCNFSFTDKYDTPVDNIQCACSHVCCPENMSILENSLTNMHLLIACDCLTKTGITTAYEFKKKRKDNDVYAKIIYNKTLQKQTTQNVTKKWEQLVVKYINVKQTKRLCNTCGVYTINILEPLWKVKCVACYLGKPVGVCFLKIKQ